MQTSEYVSGKHIKARYDVSDSTLKRWAATKKIRVVRVGDSATSKRLYHSGDVAAMFNVSSFVQPPRRVTLIYARVSSEHQRADLDRQVEHLAAAYPQAELIKDVASGLNFHRHGLTTLLERVCADTIDTVVVTHRDRLARFAMELVEWIFSQHGTKLVVLDGSANSHTEDGDGELRDDLLAVTTFFVARNNGRRSAENKKRRQADGQARKKHKTSGEFSEEDSSSADTGTAQASHALAQH